MLWNYQLKSKKPPPIAINIFCMPLSILSSSSEHYNMSHMIFQHQKYLFLYSPILFLLIQTKLEKKYPKVDNILFLFHHIVNETERWLVVLTFCSRFDTCRTFMVYFLLKQLYSFLTVYLTLFLVKLFRKLRITSLKDSILSPQLWKSNLAVFNSTR